VIDAPVLGSIPQARDGALQVFVGSSPENFKRFFEVFSALGEPVHIGPFGAGAAMKLVINSTLGALQLAFGEAMALSDALGLDSSTTLDVLEGSPIGATVQKKREKLESGVFEPNFKLSLAAKDMRLVTEAAGAAGIELLGAAAARAAFEAANDAGLGDCDYSAVAAFLSGRDARPA
jgi:3-hydroxyisobutyrate dehydrogenase-like beta-hydroxyacid dehydrogenase